MAYTINNIKQVHVAETKNERVFIGTIRNARKFQIGDNVFFAYSSFLPLQIFRGRIVGVEETQSINPEYLYKITLPDEIVDPVSNRPPAVTLNCETIFHTIEEAKQSVLDNINHWLKIKTEDCERYFSQFEKTP